MSADPSTSAGSSRMDVAARQTAGLERRIEAVAILVVIVLNGLIGFLTEWKAEAALTALRKQTLHDIDLQCAFPLDRGPTCRWSHLDLLRRRNANH